MDPHDREEHVLGIAEEPQSYSGRPSTDNSPEILIVSIAGKAYRALCPRHVIAGW